MHDNVGVIKLYEDLGFKRVPAFCVKRRNAINLELAQALLAAAAGLTTLLVALIEVIAGTSDVLVGAAATKSVVLGLLILLTARFFVPYQIEHPGWMLAFLVLTAVSFSLFGFIIGLWADDFQKLQVIPLMIVTPLTFLGGAFYSIKMLPEFWQSVTLFNPVVYLISGFRWSFYGVADVHIGVSLGMTLVFLTICLAIVWVIFRTGYKLKP